MTETALALVLLAGAGSLLKSLLTLRATAPGVTADNVLTASFWLPNRALVNANERLRFYEGVLNGVQSLPATRSAALVADLPLSGAWDSLGFQIPGRTASSARELEANVNIVSAGYFRTIGTPVRAGREFTTEDSAGTPGVIVINETAARRFWPGEDPLGKQITLSEDAVAGTLTVVGVAGDVRQMGLGEPARPEIFLNYMQPGPSWPWLVLVVRTVAEPMALAGPIRSIARSVDQRVPILEIRTLDDVLSGSLGEPQVYALLLGVFAALALVLAAVGLYGVVSYTVTERTHEMGVRMALGAVQGDVVRLVLGQGLALVVAGAAIGLGAALFMTRLLTRLIPNAVAGDPLTLSAVTALLLGVAFLAAYLPARRASRVDPMVALRCE